MADLGSVGDARVELRLNFNKFTKQLEFVRAEIDRKTEAAGRSAGRSFQRPAVRGFREAGRQSGEAFSTSLQSGLARVSGIVGGVLGIREVARFADTWTEAGNKIAAASLVSGVQADALSDISERAKEARSDFGAYVELYSRFLRQAQAVNASQREVAQATDIVSKAFKAGGASAQEQAAGIIQLGQAIGSGFLQGDELRSIRENAPLLAQAIADEFNTTIGGLRELGATGELTSERIFAGILRGAEKIQAQFDATQATIGDGFTNLRTSIVRYVGDANDALGATAGLNSALNGLANNLDLVAASIAVAGAATLGPRIQGLAALGVSLGAATAAEIKYQAAILRGAAVEIDSAQATAMRARSVAENARLAVDAARADEFAAIAKVRSAKATAEESRALLDQVKAQRAEAAARVQTLKRLEARGVVLPGLAAAQKELNTQTRAAIKFERQYRTDLKALAAAEAARATATSAVTAATNTATAATTRATAAVGALSVASRVGTVALTALSRVVAFLGGPFGVLLLGITAVSTGLIDLKLGGDEAQKAIDRLAGAADAASGTFGKLVEAQRTSVDLSDDLKEANERLATAVESGGDAAIATAQADVAAINKRIEGNAALKKSILEVLAVQQQQLAAASSAARVQFNLEFGGRPSQQQLEPFLPFETTETPSQSFEQSEAQRQATEIDAIQAEIDRKLTAGKPLNEREQEFIRLKNAMNEAGDAADEVAAKIAAVLSGETPQVDDKINDPRKRGGAGGGAGGGAADEIDERTEAFNRLIGAVDRAIDSEVREREEIGIQIEAINEEQSVREALTDQLRVQLLERELLAEAARRGIDLTQEEIDKLKEQIAVLSAVTAHRNQDQIELERHRDAAEEAQQAEEEFARALKSTGDELVRAAFEGGNFIEILANLALKLVEIQALRMAQGAAGGGGGSGGGGLLGGILSAVVGGVASYYGGPAAGQAASGAVGAFSGSGASAQTGFGSYAPSSSSYFAAGGFVSGPGTSISDSIPALLSDGEFVINAKATAEWLPVLQAINDGKDPPAFAAGGQVGAAPVQAVEYKLPEFGLGGVIKGLGSIAKIGATLGMATGVPMPGAGGLGIPFMGLSQKLGAKIPGPFGFIPRQQEKLENKIDPATYLGIRAGGFAEGGIVLPSPTVNVSYTPQGFASGGIVERQSASLAAIPGPSSVIANIPALAFGGLVRAPQRLGLGGIVGGIGKIAKIGATIGMATGAPVPGAGGFGIPFMGLAQTLGAKLPGPLGAIPRAQESVEDKIDPASYLGFSAGGFARGGLVAAPKITHSSRGDTITSSAANLVQHFAAGGLVDKPDHMPPPEMHFAKGGAVNARTYNAGAGGDTISNVGSSLVQHFSEGGIVTHTGAPALRPLTLRSGGVVISRHTEQMSHAGAAPQKFSVGGMVSVPKSTSISRGDTVSNAAQSLVQHFSTGGPVTHNAGPALRPLRLREGGIVNARSISNVSHYSAGGLVRGGGMLGNLMRQQAEAARPERAGTMMLRKSDLADMIAEGSAAGQNKPVQVVMNISTPDAGSFRRSQSQVAAEIGRMIRQGQARQT